MIKKITGCKFLSDFINELPSHVLLNKGITGCGGTTVELLSKRDSIILCPTKNLVSSKSAQGYFGVDGKVNKSEIKKYIEYNNSFKKIIATYDSLPKLMEAIPNYSEYFLLIDEYHLLFNEYSFRGEPIKFILHNFHKFKDWCFMTATPLKEEFILKELEGIPQITYEWENSTPVNIHIKDTFFIQKTLLEYIDLFKETKNIHIFLNSVSTIHSIIKKLDTDDFRIVCSENSKSRIKNFSKITDPIKKINFYTSCAFEGCDVYDPDGICMIVSDTNISTTVLDISTKIRQVCGRLRNSKYKNECYLIINTSRHRYVGTSNYSFNERVLESEKMGKRKEEMFNQLTDPFDIEIELRAYNETTYSTMYLNKFDKKIFYDENLKKMDIYNFNLISEIYSTSISVLTEFKKDNNFIPKKEEPEVGLSWIPKLSGEYTYDELKEKFEPLFNEKGLKWDHKSTIKKYFPKHSKKRRMKNGKQDTYYIF